MGPGPPHRVRIKGRAGDLTPWPARLLLSGSPPDDGDYLLASAVVTGDANEYTLVVCRRAMCGPSSTAGCPRTESVGDPLTASSSWATGGPKRPAPRS